MSQKFYQKVGVQVSMVTAIGLIIATGMTIAHQRSQLKEDNTRLQRENEQQRAEIQRLDTLLTPFRTIALERYTLPEAQALRKLAEQIGVLQEADHQKSERISQLEIDLKRTESLAEPCKLVLHSKSMTKDEKGCRVTLLFRPTKNESLGLLDFGAALPVGSSERIRDFWPTQKTSIFTAGEDSKKIADDGKSARLMYSLLSFGYPSVDLVVSGPTKVQIQGNNGLQTFEVDIK